MQVERIRALADLIEQQPHTDWSALSGFNMTHYTHNCDTPCCIAGWAAHQTGNKDRPAWIEATEYLGLADDVADNLFLMWDSDISFESVTPSHAAAVLRHLADHGVVDWTVGVSR